jgi:serine/threonine protein kinase
MSAAHETDPQGHGFEGRMLGGFRMVREIACGGMATVYLAHKAGPAGFGQPAAVKVIHPHLARDREFVEMFLDEARIVSCISHPNVCRVLDFGKAEGTYYLAMEYVMGETWGDVLHAMKQRPSAQAMIAPVLAQVLAQASEGLHAAHEARDPEGRPLSIVHRDISPQNLIVGYDGSVRVLDFGIASAAERLHTTRNGTIKGRFAYMAPEQMRGTPVDRRADLWSLGVVLWEGLAQKRLFKRDTEAETVLAVTQDALPSLQDVGHPVPTPLARIATQALNRDRDQRYGTARELGLELSRFASSSLVPVGMPEVSLWMGRLFAERIEQKRITLREAARTAEASRQLATAQATPAGNVISVPDTLITDRPEHSSSALPSVSTVREMSLLKAGTHRPSHKLLWGGPVLGALVFFVVAVGGGYLAPTPDEPPPASAPPKPRSEEQHAAARATTDTAPAPTPSPLEPTAPAPPAAEPEAEADEPERAHHRARRTQPTRAEPESSKQPASNSSSAGNSSSKKKAESTAGQFGSVSIATPGGWADVYVGSRKLGTTPGRFELPVGTHTLRIRPFGKQPEQTRRVEVSRDEAVKLKLPLE